MPPYLFELISSLQRSHGYPGCLKTLRCKTELYRNSFIPFTVNEWNKLDSDIKNSDIKCFFCNFPQKVFGFYMTCRKSIYGIYVPFGVRLINRLRFDAVNPLCSCTLETENTEHSFLLCQNNLSARTILINELNNISNAINYLNSTDSIRVILYGDKNFDVSNLKKITLTIKFIKTRKCLEEASLLVNIGNIFYGK